MPDGYSARRSSEAGHVAVVSLLCLQELLLEHDIASGLALLLLPVPHVEAGQQVAVVHRLLEDGQFGSLVGVGKLRHEVFQLIEVVSQLHSPLALHRVVEVADLSALVLVTKVALC